MKNLPSKCPKALFSKELFDELSSILSAEFGSDEGHSSSLDEIGLRIVEFVALKERKKYVARH